ncbi:MAG: hypothetical protein JW894_08370 [Bacteroidales bacterium]|nr:hypothetical protein [Bacteroidales bacterium]
MLQKFLIRFLLYFVLTLVILEISCRIFVDDNYFSRLNIYSDVENSDTISYIFIGSSRTAVSIVTEVFTKTPDKIAINAGRGYGTMQMQYRALEHLLKRNPDALKNCTVFIEAPMGICNTENGKDWVEDNNPHLLIPYINKKVLYEFLRTANESFNMKLNVILLYYFASWRDCFFIREVADVWINYQFEKYENIFLTKNNRGNNNADMLAKGGVKLDPISVKIARKVARNIVPVKINEQTPLQLEDMKSSMLYKINRLVTEAGGQICLFDTPVSSVIREIYVTDIAKNNIKVFSQWIEMNYIPLIRASFSSVDEDFPDLFHLRASRAEEYTDSLLIAYKKFNNHPEYMHEQ